MNILYSTPPRIERETAAAIAAEAFGVGGNLSPLPSERDQNFRICTATGDMFILKIANSGEDCTALEFQNAVIDALAASDPDLPIPRILRTRDDKPLTTCTASNGMVHSVRLLSYLPGKPIGHVVPSATTQYSLGTLLGRIVRALRGFGHPGAFKDLDWDLRHALRARDRVRFLADEAQREIVNFFLDRFERYATPLLPRLRAGVIHNDASDWNVLARDDAQAEVCGLIDFGDAMHTVQIAELAIGCSYAILADASPLEAAGRIAAAFHAQYPLEEIEVDLLFDLIAARLCISVTMAASRRAAAINNEYLLASELPVWSLLTRWRAINPSIARAVLRQACGFPATALAPRLGAWLAQHAATLAPLLHPRPAMQIKHVLSLSNAADPLTAAMAAGDQQQTQRAWVLLQQKTDARLGVGCWGEMRAVYTADAFRSRLVADDRRTLHLGLDLFADAGTAIHAPLDGVIVEARFSPQTQDYGGTLVLRHEPEPGLVFHSLWGHLRKVDADHSRIGMLVQRGTAFAAMGAPHENGGWLPHVHVQLISGEFPIYCDTPGVGEARFMPVWAELFPDPSPFAGLPPELFCNSGRDLQSLVKERRHRLIRNLSLSYHEPLKIVRGNGVWLYDSSGRAYLDCYNNVAHVGHCHPRVVEAIARQSRTLNTNTRYLHDLVIDYATRLSATLPAGLDVCAFGCTGSEVNDLALRIARTLTGRRDVMVIDWAYHGHTQALMEASPYKYKRAGGAGKVDFIHEVPMPDMYRPTVEATPDQLGEAYARSVEETVARLVREGRPPAAFIAESIITCGGLVFLPPQYLARAHAAVHAAGGLYIADEVQVGFGRVGRSMWAFEEHGVVPDIVTMGKPIGNGHPLSALVTTAAIADAFANGMEYFNTFGGNPVSCAAGLTVLDVLESEQLLPHADAMGMQLLTALREMADKYPIIGNVRGRGLFIGVEFVRDRTNQQPAADQASRFAEECRAMGVLLGTDGPYNNVVKLRPSMIFGNEHAMELLRVFDSCMNQLSD